jgi:predicted DNA-binding transcriptional regulator YafY
MSNESNYQRGDKFLRVISLFDSLHATHVGKTTQELADELGVDVRSVQRYIAQMQDAGLDIERDTHNRYRVGEASRLPAMQFTKPEGVAVLIALRLLQQMRTAHDDALVGAVGRLAKAMRIETVTSYLGTMLESAEGQPEAGALQRIENVVVMCFVDRIPCEIEYENVEGETSRRLIRTYFLEPRPESRTVYVYALDSKSSALRWFRMDRIRAAREVRIEGRYEVPADFDINDVTRSSWGVWQPGDELQEVVLRFKPEIVSRVRQSSWHPSATLNDLPDGGIELRLRVASEVEMRPWVLGWGSLVEVIQPRSLREHVAESMRAGARMYDGQLSSG